jgi:hypothetical protein
MHPTPLRLPLGGGFDPSAVFAALYGDRDDVFWLDSGADGMSYLGAGTPAEVDAENVWEVLRAVPEAVAPDADGSGTN